MADSQLKEFSSSYHFDGGEWGIVIYARSEEEARRKLRAAANGQVGRSISFYSHMPPSVMSLPLTILCFTINCWTKFKRLFSRHG